MESHISITASPCRQSALAHVSAFQASMGSRYAATRNYDFGPDDRSNISRLSPFIRHRLVTEAEVVATALQNHTLKTAEKFIQEVFWRTYWKGWLEQRPSVWQHYCQSLRSERQRCEEDRRLSAVLERAEAGNTGIACFDLWAQGLINTNYLHNHARMWFASIWIFTLQLPWQLGADFFLRHLLDGDPASNTLGWRWVAGLHTKGKHYVAADWNIEKFSGGRFSAPIAGLAQDPAPIEETFESGGVQPLRIAAPYDACIPSILLITEEDCFPEALGLEPETLRGAVSLAIPDARSDRSVAHAVRGFTAGAVADAALRVEQGGVAQQIPLNDPTASGLIAAAQAQGAKQIVTAYLPVGPMRNWMERALPDLAKAGITLAEIQRPWDQEIWPHATAGFFKVKKKIPHLLKMLTATPAP